MKTDTKRLIILWLFALICGLLNSCDIQKSAQKSKVDTSLKDSFEKHSFRAGDSVSYRPGKVVYKDTTIYRVTKNNTRLETVYDSNGNIRDINCYASQIEELTRQNSELEQSLKEKSSEKKEEFNSTFILYIVIGAAVIIMFGFTLVFFYLKQNANATKLILEKFIK